MDKKLAMKWVKNLRSKRFKQTRGTLHRVEEEKIGKQYKPVGYCCLGVLAATCGVNEEKIKEYSILSGPTFDICNLDSEVGKPRNGVINIRKGNEYRQYDCLFEANDDGVSFRSIASWIEKNFMRL